MEKQLVDLTGLSEMLSVSQRTIRDEFFKREDFPKPIVFGPRMKRWKVEDINNWLDILQNEEGA